MEINSISRSWAWTSLFFACRVRELTGPITQLLGVRSVWCETRVEANSQKFVLWAGYLLEKRCVRNMEFSGLNLVPTESQPPPLPHRASISALLLGKKFSFSIIVHSDPHSQLISFHPSSPILNVSADCPPDYLTEFLVSEAGGEASEAANSAHMSRAREEELLEQVQIPPTLVQVWNGDPRQILEEDIVPLSP